MTIDMVLQDLPAIQATGNREALEAAFLAVVASDEFLTILWPNEACRNVILAAEAFLDDGQPNPHAPPNVGTGC